MNSRRVVHDLDKDESYNVIMFEFSFPAMARLHLHTHRYQKTGSKSTLVIIFSLDWMMIDR